jgi:hypothetical protein
MEKFATMSGFGNVPSARANIGRLLAKILAEQETSSDASPAKDTEDGDTVAVAPASKKKAGGRKRKAGESADKVHIERSDFQDCTSIDAAETNNAEDESLTKKKASSTKRKSKVAAKAASEEEETPVKSEVGESADDDA